MPCSATVVVLLPRGAGTDCHSSEMARKLVTPLLHTQHTTEYTAVEAERDRSGVRGAEGLGRLQTFSNSFTMMQGVPGLHGTAADTIRSDACWPSQASRTSQRMLHEPGAWLT